MKHWGLILLAFLLFQQGNFLLRVIADDGFIKTKGVQLMLQGSPFYANGFNAYWLMYMAADSSQRSKVSSAFQQAKEHGLTIARTWAFSDGGDRPLQYSPGSYNEQMFRVRIKILVRLKIWFLIWFSSFVFFGFLEGVGFCGFWGQEIWD